MLERSFISWMLPWGSLWPLAHSAWWDLHCMTTPQECNNKCTVHTLCLVNFKASFFKLWHISTNPSCKDWALMLKTRLFLLGMTHFPDSHLILFLYSKTPDPIPTSWSQMHVYLFALNFFFFPFFFVDIIPLYYQHHTHVVPFLPQEHLPVG